MGINHVNIDLHINQLSLHDVDAAQRPRVAAAIEQALTLLLAGQGGSRDWSAETFTIVTSTIQVSAGAKAEAIGAQVAQSIYQQITRSESSAIPIEGSTIETRSGAQ
jgi:hypothetical protein